MLLTSRICRVLRWQTSKQTSARDKARQSESLRPKCLLKGKTNCISMINALSSLGLKDIPPLPEKFVPFFRTPVRRLPCKPVPIRGEQPPHLLLSGWDRVAEQGREKAGVWSREHRHSPQNSKRPTNQGREPLSTRIMTVPRWKMTSPLCFT